MNHSYMHLDALLREAGWLQRLCASLTRCSADADDLAQDVMSAALGQPAAQGIASRLSLRAWLGTVARRRASRVRQREGLEAGVRYASRASSAATDPGDSAQAEHSVQERAHDFAVLQRDLALMITRLPHAERTVIVGCYLENKSYRRIAAELGQSVDVVRQRHLRALCGLRARLVKDDERWTQWLPAVALGLPEAKATAGATLPVRVVAGALTLGGAVAAWGLLGTSPSPGAGVLPSRVADARVGASAPNVLLALNGPGSMALALDAALQDAGRTPIDANLPSIAFVVTGRDGTPIPSARAVWATASNGIEKVRVDRNGQGRVGLPQIQEPGVLLIAADGFLARPFHDLQPTADEPHPLALDKARTTRLRIEGSTDDLPEQLVVGLWPGFAAPVPGDQTGPRLAMLVALDLWPGTAVSRVAPGEFDLTPRFEAAEFRVSLPDRFCFQSGSGGASRYDLDSDDGDDFIVLCKPEANEGQRPVAVVEALPSFPVRFAWDDGGPFTGWVCCMPMTLDPKTFLPEGPFQAIRPDGTLRLARTERTGSDWNPIEPDEFHLAIRTSSMNHFGRDYIIDLDDVLDLKTPLLITLCRADLQPLSPLKSPPDDVQYGGGQVVPGRATVSTTTDQLVLRDCLGQLVCEHGLPLLGNPVDLAVEADRLRLLTLRVVDHAGQPIEAGHLRITGGQHGSHDGGQQADTVFNGTVCSRTLTFVGAEVELALLAPGRYLVSAWSWDQPESEHGQTTVDVHATLPKRTQSVTLTVGPQ